jgi:translation initiation factor IF-2
MMIRCGVRRSNISQLLPVRTTTGGGGIHRLQASSSGFSVTNHPSMRTENSFFNNNDYSYSTVLSSYNMPIRMFSIKPSPDESSISDKNNNNNNNNNDSVPREKEAISIFFEKRKEALAKERNQIKKQRGGRVDDNNNENNNSADTTSTTTPAKNQSKSENRQSSGFQHQQKQQRNRNNDNNNNNNNRQQHDRRQQGNNYGRNNNNNNNNFNRNNNSDSSHFRSSNNSNSNNNNNNNRRGQPEGLSDVLPDVSTQNRFKNQQQSSYSQRQGQGQYKQNYNNNNNLQNRGSSFNNNRNRFGNNRNDNNNNQKNEGTGTTRLADMMKKLRKDSPSKFQEGRSEPSLSASFSRNNNNNNNNISNNSRAPWRQKRFQIPSGDGQEAHNRRNDYNQRQSGRGSRPPQAEEFLHGRISRTDEEDLVDVVSSNGKIDMTDNNSRVVTLPVNNSLSLTEASSLFRVKVDDIKKKLRALGERIEGDVIYKKDVENSATSSSSTKIQTITTLDIDMLELLAMDFGIETVRSANEPVIVDSEKLLMQQRRISDTDLDTDEDTNTIVGTYPARPPIVTIMGHVDHGKTTLMDALRHRSQEQQRQRKKGTKPKSSKKKNSKNSGVGITKNIAGTEAGGITQIISAFQVDLDGQDEKITFLDTPGHAAFRAMRQSGSHAADVIVLVVAADDGISEQTVEIINFYKSIVKGSSDSGISMVVAVNKIDKPGIDAEEAQMRIENQLLEYGIISEGMSSEGSEFGQPVQVIPTSGLTGAGLDDLMEGLLLQSEVMDLRADDQANGEGIVMDARQEKGLGVVADCIIRWGKIEKGDVIISGDQVSQVRMLKDVNNKMLEKGLPSQPVRIIGFKSLPKAGDPIMVVASEEIAEEMLEQRRAIDPSTSDRPDGAGSDVELHITGMRRGDTWRVRKFTGKAALPKADGTVRIPIIVKADADGSLTAVRESLLNIGEDSKHTVVIDPIMEGIGEVTMSDIQMAKQSEATIFAFGSKRTDQTIINLAESEGVSICSNNIIYSLLDEARDVLGAYLPLIPKEHTHGRASVKAVFSIDTVDGEEKVAGLNVMNGYIYKSKAPAGDSSTTDLDCHFRVYRDGQLISPEGESVTASSLRRFKELVDSVRLGDECGLALSGFTDFEEGDEIECYSVELKKAKL